MLRIQPQILPVSELGHFSDCRGSDLISNLSKSQSPRHALRLHFHTTKASGRQKPFLISADSSRRRSGRRRTLPPDDHDFLEAFVLSSETIRHHNLRKQGFLEEANWQSSGHIFPFTVQKNELKSRVRSIGHGFLLHFPSPTVFLKINCDGDLLLPIVVGEFAIENLLDAFRGGGIGECPNQFEFVRNLVLTLAYEVKMIRVTERVANTYYARIYLEKPGEEAIISIDARPSDAINVAIRCKAPIYLSKQIVATDAIKIVYGRWRGNGTKSIYDVSLDSAIEGPDLLTEELDLLTRMNTAAEEERYKDAAIWRDKLTKLRMSRHDL